jgi:hypothetical protein
MAKRIGLNVGLWAALLAAAASGCKAGGCPPPCGALGSPELVLGPLDGGDVVAAFPNPCETDVDFGTLPVGQGASAK